jgi:LysR family transcriptional regulator, nitrogen assimilation regulatory protein
LLLEMRTQCPKVFITAWVATSVVLKERILNGELDIALLGIMDSDTSLECQPLFLDDMFLVGPPSALPANAKYASWARIARCPLILTSLPNSVRLLVEAAAAKNSQRLNVVMEVNYVPVLIDLVRSGIGYTLLPYSAIHELIAAGQVSATKVRDLAYNWVIATAKEKQLSTVGRYARNVLMRLMTMRLLQERWPNAKLACKPIKLPALPAKQAAAR